MAANKKTPAVRFKGFEEGWENKKLGEIFDWNIPNNTLSRANLNDNKGEIKNIHYGDILIKYNSCLNISENNIPYITNGNIVDFKQHFLKDGDIIFADAAEDEMVGKSIEICNVSYNYIVAGLHTIVARPLIKFKKYYLGYYLNSNSFHGQLISLMQGTKVLSISKNNLKKTSLNYPHPSEQNQLGNYFKELDDLIQQQEQMLEKVINLKKAMLEKMFPKENAEVPEIRFKGFNQKWNEFSIKKLCSISTGKSNTQDRKAEGRFPFYVRSPIIEKSNRFLFDEEAVLTVGDGVGTGKVFHYVNGKYDLHQRVYRMFDFQEVSAKYFYYIFSKNFHKRVMAMTAKTSVDSVRLEMISEMKVKVPHIEEQKSIVNYLDNLNQLINQSQQKITQLKHLKQALLQKMFI